jgi:hypothetical protein
MFWNFFLAHLTGDFLLQPDWMVANRDKAWVLTLHSSIHLGLMLLLVGNARSVFWPFIILIALIHFGQDALKVYLVKKSPELSKIFFILDQALHIIIILIFVSRIPFENKETLISQQPAWLMITIAFLSVSYVWFIIERILFSADLEYVRYINDTKYTRMFSRGILISIFLALRAWLLPGMAMILNNPYRPSEYRRRAILLDSTVSLAGMVFLFWALI